MSRKAFHLLLKKYVDGKCSPEEQELVGQWYELLDDESKHAKEPDDLSLVEDRMWQIIQDEITVNRDVTVKTKGFRLWSSVAFKPAAAILVVMAVIAGFAIHNTTHVAASSTSISHLPLSGDYYKKRNNTNTVMAVVLADKTIVQLQPGASVAYPKQFAKNKREIYLDGAAFFKVTKNAGSPFLVYTGTIVTQVLGTSFTVKKVDSRFEVTVLTGKVAVYEEGNKQLHNKGGVVITPNEKVTYFTDNHHFITSLVDNPVIVSNYEDSIPVKEPFNYDETPMLTIIKQLEDTYAVQIITENDKINRCLFSGNISGQSLYGMLDIICQAIGANYEIRGTSIILTGNGCDG